MLKKLNLLITLCLSFSIFVSLTIAQSGKPIESKPVPPVQELQSDKAEAKKEIPLPKANYELIEPKTVVDFMYALRDAGKRGFRLEKVTALPSGSADTSKEKVSLTVLAGIVKFDGKKQYDYNFFSAEGEGSPDGKLNNLGQNGWYFRDVVSVFGGGVKDDGIFANSIYQFPTNGNIYLLERIIGSEVPTPNYKLLKSGATLGKNPEAKIQTMLEESIKDGYRPVATYYTYLVKSLFLVDSSYNVLLEKTNAPAKLEYKFVNSGRSEGLRKEIIKLSSQGYKISLINFNSAILTRKPEKTAPVTYHWVKTDEKNYPTNFGSILAKTPVYRLGGVDQSDSGDYLKSLLIFEDISTAETDLSEYQTIKFSPIVPKEFRKNPQEYLNRFEKWEVAFPRLLGEDYSPLDLYYSDIEGLTILFERQKKP